MRRDWLAIAFWVILIGLVALAVSSGEHTTEYCGRFGC